MLTAWKEDVFASVKQIIIKHADDMTVLANTDEEIYLSFPLKDAGSTPKLFAAAHTADRAIAVYTPAFMERLPLLPDSIKKVISNNLDSKGALWIYKRNKNVFTAIDEALEFYKSNCRLLDHIRSKRMA